MPKIKLPRKSTHIDMTAMCDVAFLLLTFFMLATKFKPEEPVQITQPASTSTKIIPEGFMLITLDKNGRVFFDVDKKDQKQELIEKINADKNLGLTDPEVKSFVNGAGVGVPFSQLKQYLALSPAQQAQFDKTAKGIPTDTTASYETNELAYWLASARFFVKSKDKDGNDVQGRIAIKADGAAKYPEINKVIGTLGHLGIFKFSFSTNLKGIPPGTALAESNSKNKAE
ncbi:biopolymer transporter ExbD [Taibaiella lutea]|uniref:Biopolymer transporter ExbD n=1 Tax=Taibaiella lutea TaxID=2608001 RepID=A0A5M6CP45_9BACT|nr:biopolymer transporter ExbD [Taibaiella lutea]KAA5536786.1 biopolymer transporter ExbD [Taibaiella lutea]